jgi:hypothetical protein
MSFISRRRRTTTGSGQGPTPPQPSTPPARVLSLTRTNAGHQGVELKGASESADGLYQLGSPTSKAELMGRLNNMLGARPGTLNAMLDKISHLPDGFTVTVDLQQVKAARLQCIQDPDQNFTDWTLDENVPGIEVLRSDGRKTRLEPTTPGPVEPTAPSTNGGQPTANGRPAAPEARQRPSRTVNPLPHSGVPTIRNGQGTKGSSKFGPLGL